MIRALLLIVLLSGCATVQPPLHYASGPLTDENPCVIVNGQPWCLDSSTREEQQAWADYHTQPVIDECEAESLRRHRWAAIADSGSTIGVLAVCAGVSEANPLVAFIPGGWAILPISAGLYYAHRSHAAKTSRWQENWQADDCPLRGEDAAFAIRGAAALNNTILLAGCL